MKCNVLFFAGLLSSVLLVSCSKDENTVAAGQNYANGILVVNEGNSAAGSVSFIKSNFSSVVGNVYALENSSDGLGGYVQSIFFNGDNAYIVSGSANMITVVNRNTFKLVAKISTGLLNPRYGVIYNGKAYVTNYNDPTNYTDDYIAVINLSTNLVENSFNVNSIANRIIEKNGKLYVTDGDYDQGHTVQVINPSTSTVVKTLDMGAGKSPNSFEEANGKLYVLAGNYANESKLVVIDLSTDTIENSIDFPTGMINVQNLNVENNMLYFTMGSNVYDEAVATTTISDTPLFNSTALSLYGFTVKGNEFYITDAKDYVSSGDALIYSNTGTLLYQIQVGLIPNGFYFN